MMSPPLLTISFLFYDQLVTAGGLVTHSCPVVVGSDFNIHIHDPDDSDSRRFCELPSSFDMVQHVTAATHQCGGTLDLVMTFDGALINEVRAILLFCLIIHWSSVGCALTPAKPEQQSV